MRFVAHVGRLCETPSRWSEGCICHEDHRHLYLRSTPKQKRMLPEPLCVFKGCRAPEMATGDVLTVLRRQARLTEPILQQHLHEASSPQVASDLLLDWQRAMSTVMSTLLPKLHYWRELPYVLCGLAHPDPQQVARLDALFMLLMSCCGIAAYRF